VPELWPEIAAASAAAIAMGLLQVVLRTQAGAAVETARRADPTHQVGEVTMDTQQIPAQDIDATCEWLVDEMIGIALTGQPLTVDMPEEAFRQKRAAMLEDTKEIVYGLLGRGRT